MQIRTLRPGDAEQAFQLRVAAFSSATRLTYDPDEIYIPDELRLVAVDAGRIVGHIGIWPFRQAFMGRAVPMGGVAAAVVADDRRGAGVGSRLIGAALDHMADAGMAISSLYPSTLIPYRRWGWEVAGVHMRRRVWTRDLLDLPATAADIELRPYAPSDLDAVVAIHDGLTRGEPGGLVGGARWLRRALQPDPDEPEITLVATRGGSPVGLMLASKTAIDGEHGAYGLHVLRLLGVDRDVERTLWRSIGHHHPVAGVTTFLSRPAEPLLFDLPHAVSVSHIGTVHFMTRLVEAPAAIAARGWPALSASIDLDVVDDRRPANHGRFVLELDGREATLTPGGSGRVRIDIGALSSLYTGFVTAAQLAHAGRLTGARADDLDALGEVFSAPLPFLRDYF